MEHQVQPIPLSDFEEFKKSAITLVNCVDGNKKLKLLTENQLEQKLPQVIQPLYEQLHKTLSECGLIEAQTSGSQIDKVAKEQIIKSLMRMHKNLENQDLDVEECIHMMIADLARNVSQEVSLQIRLIVESMHEDFTQLKNLCQKELFEQIDSQSQILKIGQYVEEKDLKIASQEKINAFQKQQIDGKDQIIQRLKNDSRNFKTHQDGCLKQLQIDRMGDPKSLYIQDHEEIVITENTDQDRQPFEFTDRKLIENTNLKRQESIKSTDDSQVEAKNQTSNSNAPKRWRLIFFIIVCLIISLIIGILFGRFLISKHDIQIIDLPKYENCTRCGNFFHNGTNTGVCGNSTVNNTITPPFIGTKPPKDDPLVNNTNPIDVKTKAFIVHLFRDDDVQILQLYKALRDGFNERAFHEKCDQMGATISFFKLESGIIIGGFTRAQWESTHYSKWENDPSACMFSLSSQRIFPVIQSERAIVNFSQLGPNFGDSVITKMSWLSKSFSQVIVKNIPLDQHGNSALTGQKGEYFTITELEVYQITTSPKFNQTKYLQRMEQFKQQNKNI